MAQRPLTAFSRKHGYLLRFYPGVRLMRFPFRSLLPTLGMVVEKFLTRDIAFLSNSFTVNIQVNREWYADDK